MPSICLALEIHCLIKEDKELALRGIRPSEEDTQQISDQQCEVVRTT